MSSGWKGLAVGALGLVALETAIGGKNAAEQTARANRAGALFDVVVNAARRFLDPGVPAFGSMPTPAPAQTPVANAVDTTPPSSTSSAPAGHLLGGSPIPYNPPTQGVLA